MAVAAWSVSEVIAGGLLLHLVGRTRVHLFAPVQRTALYSEYRFNNRECVSPLDLSRPHEANMRDWPRFANATATAIYELWPGDALYVPCGWYHFVEYATSGMSISSYVMADWQHAQQVHCLEEVDRVNDEQPDDYADHDLCLPHTCAAWASPHALERSMRLGIQLLMMGSMESEVTLPSASTFAHVCREPSQAHPSSGMTTCYSAACMLTSSARVHKTFFALPSHAGACLGVNPRSELATAFYTAILNLRSVRRLGELATKGVPHIAAISSLRLVVPKASQTTGGAARHVEEPHGSSDDDMNGEDYTDGFEEHSLLHALGAAVLRTLVKRWTATTIQSATPGV